MNLEYIEDIDRTITVEELLDHMVILWHQRPHKNDDVILSLDGTALFYLR